MRKARYLALLLEQTPAWIAGSLAHRGSGMTAVHIALHRIALRRLGA